MFSDINKKLKVENVFLVADPDIIQPTLASIAICCHNNIYHVLVSAGGPRYTLSSIDDAVLLALKCHYVFNLKYSTETKSFYGVVEMLLGIPVTVVLGAFANKFAWEFLDRPDSVR